MCVGVLCVHVCVFLVCVCSSGMSTGCISHPGVYHTHTHTNTQSVRKKDEQKPAIWDLLINNTDSTEIWDKHKHTHTHTWSIITHTHKQTNTQLMQLQQSTPTCKRSRYFQTRHLSSVRTTTALVGTAARWHRSYSSRPASVPSGHSSFRSSSSRSRAQDSWFLPGQEEESRCVRFFFYFKQTITEGGGA